MTGIANAMKRLVLETVESSFQSAHYLSPEELQTDLNVWLAYYNNERTHQGDVLWTHTSANPDCMKEGLERKSHQPELI
jgi:hypothetical protein